MRPAARWVLVSMAVAAAGTSSARAAAPDTGVHCARTPEAAALQSVAEPGAAQPGETQLGFRLIGLHSDVLRGRAWAVVGNCSDASKPLIAVALDGPLPGASRTAVGAGAGSAEGTVRLPVLAPGAVQATAGPLVHTGDRLRVVSASGESQMELEGSAEEPGQAGSALRVRLARLGGEGEPPRVLHCRVLAAGLVEVLP